MRKGAHSKGTKRHPLKAGSRVAAFSLACVLALGVSPAVSLATTESPDADGAQPETTEVATEEATEITTDVTGATAETEGAGTESTVTNDAAQTNVEAGIATLADEPSSTEATTDEEAGIATQADVQLSDGVNIVKESQSGQTFTIDEDKVVMIANQGASTPIVFDNCTFELGGRTAKISGAQDGISYNNGETVTKLFVSGNVQFNNCTFVTAEGATKTTSAGYDAAIYFYDGDINLNSCTLTAEDYNGQFLGLYGSTGAVTFDGCDIATKGNIDGWSYAMYAGSVLNLKNSTMSATGMTRTGSNINAFYSGDLRTEYDAINIENSTIDFSDNQAGGFAINNVNIHVTRSTIKVNDNLGNACNSGYWIVDDSTIQMNGNRGGHALSCIGFEMTDSRLKILHNGYAGVYVQKKDSSLTNCSVDVRCNGEKMLSYSAGDVWLNTHKLTVKGTTNSEAQPGSLWLGAVGRKGSVETIGYASVVAYDLNSNAGDNLKSKTGPTLESAQVVLNGQDDLHTLLLNPFMTTDYARGNAENTASSNDVDLFKTDAIGKEFDPQPTFESDEEKIAYILGGETAKIGTLTDAQLSHHIYDWNAGVVKYEASADTYGALAYPCVDVCADYVGNTNAHKWSFDCPGTYVYAPLVGLTFDANVSEEGVDPTVTNMPEAQTQIAYEGTATVPETAPVRECSTEGMQWVFTGWYTDAECTTEFDFTNALTSNWTVVYAGWSLEPIPEEPVAPTTPEEEEPTPLPTEDEPTALAKTGDNTPVAAVALGGIACAAVAAFAIRKAASRR